MIRPLALAAFSFAAALSICRFAAADVDPQMAARLFQEAEQAYRRGEYAAAARAFDEANRYAPRGRTAYNAALAWQVAGNAPRAADAFELALSLGQLEPEQETDARQRLTALEKSLGVVEITGPSEARATLAHALDVGLPAKIHVEAGQHAVHAKLADGTPLTRTVSVTAGQLARVDFGARATSEAASVAQRGAAPKETPALADRASDGTTQRTFGWISLGLAGVAAGAAVVFGVQALGARDDYYDSKFTDIDARDRASSFRTITNVAWLVAAASAGTGVVLLLTAPSGERAAGSPGAYVGWSRSF